MDTNHIETQDNISRPIISVLIPSFNTGEYIRQCLESVVSQTIKEIEIICIDAGSTDGSLEVLQEFAAKDSRIILLNSPQKSYGYQMNMGLKIAKGHYIGIVETDDYIASDMYEKLTGKADETGVEVVKTNHFRLSKATEVVSKTYRDVVFPFDEIISPKDYLDLFLTIPSIWNGIYDRQFLLDNGIDFNETPGSACQDVAFILKVYLCAERVLLLNEPYYHYRVDNEGTLAKTTAQAFSVCDEFESVQKFMDDRPSCNIWFSEIVLARKLIVYKWNYDRLPDEYRLDFLYAARKELKNDKREGNINDEVIPKRVREFLPGAMNTPEVYYLNNRGEKLGITVEWKPEDVEAVKNPKYTIIIMGRNDDSNMLRAVKSVLTQTESDLEALCVENFDDGKLAEIAGHDKRLALGYASFADAARAAKGEYIIPLDSDDMLVSAALSRISKEYNADENTNVVLFNGFAASEKGAKKNGWIKKDNVPDGFDFNINSDDDGKPLLVSNSEILNYSIKKSLMMDILSHNAEISCGKKAENLALYTELILYAESIVTVYDGLLIHSAVKALNAESEIKKAVAALETGKKAFNQELYKDCRLGFDNLLIEAILRVFDDISSFEAIKRYFAELRNSELGVEKLLSHEEDYYVDDEPVKKLASLMAAYEWADKGGVEQLKSDSSAEKTDNSQDEIADDKFAESYRLFMEYLNLLENSSVCIGADEAEESTLMSEGKANYLENARKAYSRANYMEKYYYYYLPLKEAVLFDSLVVDPVKLSLEKKDAKGNASKKAVEEIRLLKGDLSRKEAEIRSLKSQIDKLKDELEQCKESSMKRKRWF